MAQNTYSAAEVGKWVATASAIFEDAVDDELERDAGNAAANIMSGSGFLDAPCEIVDMFTQLIKAGYTHALRDVRDGRYDADLTAWRG